MSDRKPISDASASGVTKNPESARESGADENPDCDCRWMKGKCDDCDKRDFEAALRRAGY